MIDKKQSELIQKDVDGYTTPQEKEELEQVLAGNPEARALLRDLNQVGYWLGQVPPADPPEDMKREIMAKISARPAAGKLPARPLFGFLTGMAPRFRYPLVFASGLAAGFLLFILAVSLPRFNSGEDAGRMSGTMLPEFTVHETAPQTESTIQKPGISGEIRWYRDSNRFYARIDLHTSRPVQVSVLYDASEAGFTGVTWLTPPSTEALNLSPGVVLLSVSGNSSCRVAFQPTRSGKMPFTVKLSAAGQVLFHKGFELK